MDWDSVGLAALVIGLAAYTIFFNSIIEGIDSFLRTIGDCFENIITLLTDALRSRLLRIIQILLLATIFLAFSSELFADQKAPPNGAFIMLSLITFPLAYLSSRGIYP